MTPAALFSRQEDGSGELVIMDMDPDNCDNVYVVKTTDAEIREFADDLLSLVDGRRS